MLAQSRLLCLAAVLLLAYCLPGCSLFKQVSRDTVTPDSLRTLSGDRLERMSEVSPYMKVHMNSGSVYVLHSWTTERVRGQVLGEGVQYGATRDLLREGQWTIGLDSVAIIETNVLRNSGAAAALTVLTGVSAAVTAACIANPKACSGWPRRVANSP
jgi:hypothetical protein